MLKPKTYAIVKDYKLTNDALGVGISGKVVTCYRLSDNKKCALKVLGNNEKARREVDLHWRARGCKNIVDIYDVYENNNQVTKRNHLLVVQECMEGGELFHKIQKRADRAFTEREAAKIVYDISNAIKYLHDMNIAHRDVKPENLLYNGEGQDAVLKLTDFGFAKEVGAIKVLQTPCYTPYYVAPEVLGPEKYDKSCDLWSLGVITYILLCGYPPFFSQNGQPISPGMKQRIRNGQYTFPAAEWAHVSDNGKDLIRNLLLVDPEKRLDIHGVVHHPWIAQYHQVPQTPLATSENFKADPECLLMLRDDFGKALDSMRADNQVTLKTLNKTNNPILKKRQMKTAPDAIAE